jgi:hypothetical protein
MKLSGQERCNVTEPESPIVLAADWHVEIHVAGVDQNRPGVYEWRIEGVGVYIGQYTRTSRPRREYGKNVSNILNGRPYRKGKVTSSASFIASLRVPSKTDAGSPCR